MLFLWGMEFDRQVLERNAVLTFFYTLVITILFSIFDDTRRRNSVDRPLQRILEGLDRIQKGDFSVRLDSSHRDFSQTGLQEICKGINRLAQELSGVETLRTDFISNVSHELKTPLAAVQNYAALLKNPDLSDTERAEYTQAITQTTKRLADMISNILRLNKLENQQIFPETHVFDLGEHVAAALLEWEDAWEAKHLDLNCDLEDNVMVESDPELLLLVWNNLISNAIKFSGEGGSLTVTVSTQPQWACVSVTDTGCGMSPETGAHIFEKFYQGDTAHATQGNGLGLALVKRVIHILGAEISVSSALGVGSTFTVRLRRKQNGAT